MQYVVFTRDTLEHAPAAPMSHWGIPGRTDLAWCGTPLQGIAAGGRDSDCVVCSEIEQTWRQENGA